MNWLAHLLLADPVPDAQAGSILADIMKGEPWEGMSDAFWDSVERHRQVDSFTDAHPVFLASRQRLGSRGRLHGVVVDLVYDHMLTRNWSAFANQPLRPFLDEFYTAVQARSPDYPEEARCFLRTIVADDRLASYGTLDGLAAALQRIDARFQGPSRSRRTAMSYLPAVTENHQDLERDFLGFFPEVLAFVATAPQVFRPNVGGWCRPTR